MLVYRSVKQKQFWNRWMEEGQFGDWTKHSPFNRKDLGFASSNWSNPLESPPKRCLPWHKGMESPPQNSLKKFRFLGFPGTLNNQPKAYHFLMDGGLVISNHFSMIWSQSNWKQPIKTGCLEFQVILNCPGSVFGLIAFREFWKTSHPDHFANPQILSVQKISNRTH